MFEYGVDIAVFHGALISSVEKTEGFLRELRNEGNFSKENIYTQLKKEHCKKIAHVIAEAFHEVHSELESTCSNDSMDLHHRLHAAAFYAALSCRKPKDYEGYFEALSGVFPDIGWGLYFELVKAFQWNRHFIECTSVLPLDVASKLVELAIKHVEEEPIDADSSLLDSCVEITFRQSYSYIHGCNACKEEDASQNISHELEIMNNIPQEVTTAKLDFMVKCNVHCIQSLWSSAPASKNIVDFNITKVSIHILLTFFNCLKDSKYEDFALNFIESISDKTYVTNASGMCERLCKISVKKEEIVALLKDMGDLIKLACEILMSDEGQAFIAHMYDEFGNTHSWKNVSFGLLFHQFVDCLDEFIILCSSMDFDEELQVMISSVVKISVILDEYKGEGNNWLSEVHSLLLWSTDASLYTYHVLMGNIMGKRNFIAEESVLEFLERNMDLLCKPIYISTLMEIILNNEVLRKERLIKIFLDAFQGLEVQQQKTILNTFINSYGIVEVFRSSDFNSQLVHFLNQIVKGEKLADKMQLQILPLCIQSPFGVIRQIILQAMKNKGGITVLVQILKILSFICNYKDDSRSPSLLIKCFSIIIKTEDLSKHQKENSLDLIQTLFQYKNGSKYEIMSSEDVLRWCILPHLKVSTSASLLDFSVDLLQIVIKEIQFWSKETRKVAVVWCLYQVLQHYTMERNGERRQVIIPIINLLMSQETSFTDKDIIWLETQVKAINPLWYLWLEMKFFNKDIEPEKFEDIPLVDVLIGSSFGLTKGIASATVQAKLKKKSPDLRYSYLVISLSKILLHSIPSEWIFCFEAVTSSLEEGLQISPTMNSLSNNIKESNKNLSVTFHIFIDALILLNSTNLSSIPWHYMISCFNKLVKDIYHCIGRSGGYRNP